MDSHEWGIGETALSGARSGPPSGFLSSWYQLEGRVSRSFDIHSGR
ncbi:hypothetical protein FEAC_24220 [Ferrimicrobium acidiphilum DSM 19497]|uniref:Uncharacterized protein n=1 Tax=Ferrimicrobium acidiphilum DSM 19497 TaxID=1121877 RepID=A0A0D8FUD4_9ACTN|nr:hypothetical protein FEAC_24220 [Ferrimicrobium acidiphilum DSM 19497]